MNLLSKLILILTITLVAMFLFLKVTGLQGYLSGENQAKTEVHDEDENEEANKVIIVDGFKALSLDEDIIIASGIVSEKVEKLFFESETIAYAEVIDIESLVNLKTEYEAALAEQNILIGDLRSHNKILQRAEALHKAKSLPATELDKSRADRDLKSSQLRAVNTHLASIKYKTKSLWGEQLSAYLFDENRRSDFDTLAVNKVKLILLSLGKEQSFNHQEQRVYISDSNNRNTAVAASYLDVANRVSNPLYGESYFYLAESNKLRTGMKSYAWIEDASDKIEGLFVPESAVIWYANEPWLYLNRDESVFIRKPLGNAKKINKGWLLEDESIINNDLLVVQGGQTLLSEEFKWAIPDEDDD